MSTRTTVLLLDDIDGSDADESVAFSFDGVEYEIDLTAENAAKLRDSLELWRAAARRTGGKQTTRTGQRIPRQAKPSEGDKPDRRFTENERPGLRKFAEQTGRPPVAERGRVHRETIDAWIAAGRPL